MACTQTSVHALAQRDAIHSLTLSFLQPPPSYQKKREGTFAGTVESEMTALSLSLVHFPGTLTAVCKATAPQGSAWSELQPLIASVHIKHHWEADFLGRCWRTLCQLLTNSEHALTCMIPMFPNGHWRAVSVTFLRKLLTVFCVCASHTRRATNTHKHPILTLYFYPYFIFPSSNHSPCSFVRLQSTPSTALRTSTLSPNFCQLEFNGVSSIKHSGSSPLLSSEKLRKGEHNLTH